MTPVAESIQTPEATVAEKFQVDPEALFAWWASLDTPYTRETQFSDWNVSIYRDAACFTRYPGVVDGFLVRGKAMMHFGFDHDTIESAYEALPPRVVEDDSASIIRRMARQLSR